MLVLLIVVCVLMEKNVSYSKINSRLVFLNMVGIFIVIILLFFFFVGFEIVIMV